MKYFFKVLIILLTAMILISLSACRNNEINKNKGTIGPEETPAITETSYPYTFTDSRGEKVTINAEPKRIISMAPNITEIIYALGKGDALVGRTDFCNYPEDVSKVSSIGNIYVPDLEKIISLQPDLVLISGTTMPDSLKSLEDVDIKFIVINEQEDFDGVYETIESIGKIVNANSRAVEIINGMKAKVADVLEKVKDLPKPKTYYIMSYGEFGEYTATGDTFLGKMIDMAGGDNIAKDAIGWKYNLEDIVSRNPEVLLVSPMGGMITDPNSALANENGYKDLKAVKDKKAVLVDDDLINRQGPRLAEGLEHLARAIHPEVFEND